MSRGWKAAAILVLCGCGVPTEQRTHPFAVGGPLFETTKSRSIFVATGRYLIIEALDDDLLHFEVAAGAPPSLDRPIYTTPMVAKTDYPGPRTFHADKNGVETAELRATVGMDLCVTVYDKIRQRELHTLCPTRLEETWKGFSLDSPGARHVYGLGQYFDDEAADGDWIGRVWDPLYEGYGAALRGFAGGANNYSLFPIMYALGEGHETYGLFVDQVYKQMWDFRGTPWHVGMWGDQIRWYVLSGDNLADVRQDYMELTGRPPVPPRRSFGLWVSEFGFRNWAEVETELGHLRQHHLPVDGFALDLQWFGGTFGDPDRSRMGSLTWDERAFPAPAEHIQRFREVEGVRLMLIEEPYISETLVEHRVLAERGYMARECATCGPAYLDENPWWGRGGMVDFTNPAGSDFWHDYRRRPLVAMGIQDHWADLGEPEQYKASAWYYGFPELGKHAHPDVHNIYGFRWMESIARGYARHGEHDRPFLLSRTGTSGIQRFGVGIWSGDIGTNWGNLRSQMQAQMQMSFSGVDYYGSDAGGFQRNDEVRGGERLYTQWFAASAALDVPLRPHAWNLDKKRLTSPSRRGDIEANRQSLRRRYELAPYYYSLAFRAYLHGEPVFPPLVHYYQHDMATRRLGTHKMIGRDLLTVLAADPDAVSQRIYLPEGSWYDFHTGDVLESRGDYLNGIPLYPEGHFRLPLYARAGAIIPMMHVDDDTLNISGLRADGRMRHDLKLKIFAGTEATVFDLYEDDGETFAYESGRYAVTRIEQHTGRDEMSVVIHPTSGGYGGMPTERPYELELYLGDRIFKGVSLDGATLRSCGASGHGDASCYEVTRNGALRVRAGVRSIDRRKELRVAVEEVTAVSSSAYFVCREGRTTPGTSVYAVGSVPQLGLWDPAKAVLLSPSVYPVWVGRVDDLPRGERIEWKCLKRHEGDTDSVIWQTGANNVLTTVNAGFVGETIGSF